MESYHTSVDYSLMNPFNPSYFIDTPSNFDSLLQHNDYTVSFYQESSKE